MPQTDSPSFKDVWSTLSVINVNDYTEEKFGLTFLSWGYCWAILMKHFPQAQYAFDDNEIHPDGSVTVYCTVNIGECSRSMHLPVMDHKMNAISLASKAPPSSRDISDTKMRCLVKCVAMLGLGAYLYCGEKNPENEGNGRQEDAKPEPVPDTPPVKNVAPPASQTLSPDDNWLPKDKESADQWVSVALDFMEKGDKQSLKNLPNANKRIVAHIKDKYPDAYKRLQAVIKQKDTGQPVAENVPSGASEGSSQPVYDEGDEGYLPDNDANAHHWAEVTVKFIKKHCDDTFSLDALWQTDKECITHVENNYPAAYAIVKAGFKQRYADLKEST